MLERGIKLLPSQGVTNERALPQSVASLALLGAIALSGRTLKGKVY